ncbi:MAG TPA: hypothetical protein V6D14_08545 [Coleofasciculaceae cyanobacterium]
MPYTRVIHPIADTSVADELSGSTRLIYRRLLSCFPLSFELYNHHLTWKKLRKPNSSTNQAVLEGPGLYPISFGQIKNSC